MKRELYVHSFRPVLPSNHLNQDIIVDWILKAHSRTEYLTNGTQDVDLMENRLRRFTLSSNYIQNRYFECNELDENWEEHEIYKLVQENPSGVTIGTRNQYFGKKVIKVFDELYQFKMPFHLIHVSCTGYLSPSPAQIYFSQKKNAPEISHAYQMGCYASLPSIRLAMGMSLSEGADIDIVHTEMCSLHLDSSTHTPEQIVVQTLFADGHIKYSVGPERKGLKILAIKEKIISETQTDMTWIPDSYGMKMTLSRDVPFKIRDHLPEFIDELCKKAKVDKNEILKNAIFAIHPGGPKIIDAVARKLELKSEQFELSKKVLFERGNMSSATLPHIWNEILNSSPSNERKILSLAFGPGLTIFGSIFEISV